MADKRPAGFSGRPSRNGVLLPSLESRSWTLQPWNVNEMSREISC